MIIDYTSLKIFYQYYHTYMYINCVAEIQMNHIIMK